VKRSILVLLLVLASCSAPGGPDPISRAEDRRHPSSPELIELLATGDAEQRVRAARAMGRIQSSAYVDALAAAVADEDRSVKLAALFALGQLGLLQDSTPPPAAFAAARAALDAADPEVIAAALEAMGKLAPEEAPATIAPFLSHVSGPVRAEAAMALFRCRFSPLWRGETDEAPPLPGAAVTALLGTMDDPDLLARRMKVYVFSRYAQQGVGAAMGQFAEDDDEWVRLFALRSIGRAGGTVLAGPMTSALEDPSERVRTEAVQALAALDLTRRIPAEVADDPSFHVRAAFATALGAAETPESIRLLRTLESDDSPTVRAAAIDAVTRRLGDAYTGELVARIRGEAFPINVAAAAAARWLPPASKLEVVAVAMTDGDNRVKTAGLSALDADGPSPIVFEALGADDLALRGTAVGLVAGIDGLDDSTRLEQLAGAYDGSPGVDWIEVREAIVDAIADLEGAEPLLRRMEADDPASSVRGRARAALAERGVELPEEDAPAAELSPFIDRRFAEDPVVALETPKGTIRIRCLADEAPIHVASFVDLVGKGYYDGLIWHRVVSNFVIQGGDPRGDGWGGAGYALRDEIHTGRYGRGAVGMPKAGKDTGGGQLFITHVPTPHLDGNYTIFGQVIEGLDVVDRIEVGDSIVGARVE
jgi:cyclophilin family peptidyl-prolyl cis-trans isomerase/HEAT repeat protein